MATPTHELFAGPAPSLEAWPLVKVAEGNLTQCKAVMAGLDLAARQDQTVVAFIFNRQDARICYWQDGPDWVRHWWQW